MPLVKTDQESGVGRWYTLRISTHLFYEYLQIKKITLAHISSITTFLIYFNIQQHINVRPILTV